MIQRETSTTRSPKNLKSKPALNADLWKELLRLMQIHQVQFIWVKGHAGHPENERCDALAVMQRDKFQTG